MKKYLLLPAFVCATFAAVSPALHAQGTSPAPSASQSPAVATDEHHHGGNPMERMSKELNLTDDQKAKIKPIMEDRHEKMKALREDASLTPEQKKEKGKALFEASNDQIKAILTPDQQTKFAQMQADMKEHREKHDKQ